MKKTNLLLLAILTWSLGTLAQGITYKSDYVNPSAGTNHLDFPWKNQVSPDGKHLYVAGSSSDAISYYSINATTGALTFQGYETNGTSLDATRCVAISPDGNYVYVGSGTGGSIVVYSRNPSTGVITFVEELRDDEETGGTIPSLDYVDEILISPDGKHLYACGASDDAVNAFSINSSDGKLTLIASYIDIEQGGSFNYLDNSRYFGMDANGDNLYVASGGDDAITVFSRNSTSGQLTLVEEIVNLAGGITGIDGVRKIVVSHDGSQLYAMGYTSDAIAHFSRNTSTGALTFVKEYVGGVDVSASLNRPSLAVIQSDDKYLFVTANSGDAFLVYSINPSTGALTEEEVVTDDNKGGSISNLNGALGLSITPNGQFLYVGATSDDAINVFENDDPPKDPSTLAVELSIDQLVSCPNGNDGSITASVTPGAPNYTYSWSNGAVSSNTSSTTNSISGLTASTYTVTITDNDGETATASIALTTTTDVTDPTIGAISPKSVDVDGNCTASLPDYTGLAVVSDNCDASPTVTQSPTAATTITSTTEVTLTVTDASGNSSNTKFDVTLVDVTDPTIGAISPKSVDVDGNCTALLPDYTGLAVVSDNCDASPTVTQSPTAATTITSTTEVTLTVTDASGNSSNTKFNVSLADVTDPTIGAISPKSLDVDGNCTASLPDYTGLAVVSDNCDASPTVTQSPTAATTITSTTEVTLTVTDASGNSSNTKFDVTLVDVTDPTIGAISPKSVDVDGNCSALLPDYTGLAVVSDNCDASPTVTQSPTAATTITSTTEVTLTVTDASGNSSNTKFNVTLDDVTDPTIGAISPKSVDVDGNCSALLPDYTGLAVVSDNCDASPTVTQSPTAATTITSTTEVTLTVTDASGNSSNTKFDVSLADVTDPTIGAISPKSVDVDGNCTALLPDYTGLAVVSDNCDASPTVTQSPTAATTITSTTEVTLTVTDASGNSSNTKFDVTLVDVTPPVAPTLADIESSCPITPPSPSAQDNCSGSIMGTTSSLFPISQLGTTIISWTFTDSEGNKSIVNQNVTITSLDISITAVSNTISANNPDVDSYQWVDCDDNNSLITGETSQTFTTLGSGNFAVILTEGLCKDTSACETVVITDITSAANTFGLSIFPTLANSTLFITNDNGESGKITLLDVLGNVIQTIESKAGYKHELSVENLQPGTYLIRVETALGTYSQKFIKN